MKRWIPCTLLLVLLAVRPLFCQPSEEPGGASFGLGERVIIEQSVLDRWEQVSRMAVGPRAQEYIVEGQQILARYRELASLEASHAEGSTLTDLNIEISKLKLTLINLLRDIEEASLFHMNPQQLKELREQYLSRQEELFAERERVRGEVLDRGEGFLHSYRRDRRLQRFSQRDVVAKLCLRLAELYYDKSEEDYFQAQDELLLRAESGLPPGTEPVRNFKDAVRKYQRIIDEFPFSEYMDDALYNVAFIRESTHDEIQLQEARRLYEQLVRDFPRSGYAPEAWMRLGEFWFGREGEEELAAAVDCYAQVLDYPEYRSREKALYKLGWCFYKLQDNPQSVAYFTEAAKFAHRRLAEGERTGADLLEESIGYIAVNYADTEWDQADIAHLSAFVEGDPEIRERFGFQLMNRYGDLFKDEVQDFDKAVAAYDSLLALYPHAPEAPFIQEKIIACYGSGALNNPEMAYVEKNELFDRYQLGGDWAVATAEKDETVLNSLLEQHLVQNVAIAMHRAYDTGLREHVDEFVGLSRKYLGAFPEDTSAFSIHWNMAKTLESQVKDHVTAYDEYLAISRAFPDRDVRDAAYNAIVLGQLLVDQELAEVPEAPPEEAAEEITELSEMEGRKLAALENFIELFPEDDDTPEYLVLAGKLYYAHADYTTAQTYFDRLIIEYSASPQLEEAYKLRLEGLFALGLFQEAEQTAKIIQDLGLSEELAGRARNRQAESVYAFAEELKEQEDHLSAAQEFKRMALEVPDADFADASLFDAANEFTLAGEWLESAETYIYLADHYPASEYADRSISLAGFLYLNELEDMTSASLTFEKLALQYPASEFAKASISNAAYCYEKNGDWESTIRMNQLYVDRYPDADDANLILFDNAGLYLKLEDIESANRIYADFAERYPTDPRTVQAFVERAEYFLSLEDEAAAREEFRQAVERNRELLARGGEGNALHASGALRRLVAWQFEDYAEMELHQPADRLQREVEEKKRVRDDLLGQFNELIQLGAVDVSYARFMIAAAHDEFARTYRSQELPDYRSPEEAASGRVEILDASHELSMLAVESYISTTNELESVVESLQRQRSELEQSRIALDDYIASFDKDTLGAPEDSLKQQLTLKKAADVLDSSLTESTRWTTRSREKVPEVVMADLEEYEQRIDLALGLRSGYRDDVFLRLADMDKNLLGQAAMITTQAVVQAYRVGLETIARVGLDRIWRERVEERVRGAVWKLPRAYEAFATECYDELDASVDHFLETIEQGEDYVDAQGLGEEDYGNDVLDMVDFNKGYAINSLLVYDSVIKTLEENYFGGSLTARLSDSLAASALRLSARLGERSGRIGGQKEDYWSRFEESSSYVFRDAHMILEDTEYFLDMTSTEVMVQAEPVVSRVNSGSLPARRLLFSLAQRDPARFGDKFGLSEEQFEVRTGPDWLSAEFYQEGYESVDFDDSGWPAMGRSPSAALAELVDAPVIWSALPGGQPVPAAAEPDTLWITAEELERARVLAVLDTLSRPAGEPQDTLAAEQVMYHAVVQPEEAAPAPGRATGISDTLFVRRSFDVPGTPVGATLELAADDACYLFFNGEYIDEVLADSGFVGGSGSYALDEFVVPGRNTLALEIQDRDGSGGGLAALVRVRQMARLTEELFEEQLQRELVRQRELELRREVNRIYDKNRVD